MNVGCPFCLRLELIGGLVGGLFGGLAVVTSALFAGLVIVMNCVSGLVYQLTLF